MWQVDPINRREDCEIQGRDVVYRVVPGVSALPGGRLEAPYREVSPSAPTVNNAEPPGAIPVEEDLPVIDGWHYLYR